MIIDYTQNKDNNIDISYVNNVNQITVDNLLLNDSYYNYIECEEFDPNRIKDLTSFYGSFIKKEKAKFFSHHNINEFFNYDIPKNYPEYFKKFNTLNEVNPFSTDIEVLPTDRYGYSKSTEANNPVTSIQFTDKFLNSILFTVKNPLHPIINDIDMGYIDSIVSQTLGKHANDYAFEKAIRIFDTEIEMLQVFLECINKHFHLIMGWNFIEFDWQYIYYRCEKLGLDIKKASPIRKLTKKSIDINERTKIEYHIPSHRVISDYMFLFKDSLIYNNLGSYSLDSTAELILGLHKVKYEGNLRTLYDTDYLKFIAYGFVDPILVQLIHKSTNLLTVDFFQSYYTGVPYLRLSQNSISEALVYQELRETNQFLLETEKTNNPSRKYQGGYVKSPLKKIVGSVMGEDYGGLYPNSMITMGLSPEAKVDTISVNTDGFPLNEIENQKWLNYKALGYSLSPMGRIYRKDKDYLYTRIEKKLLKQRKIFKGHMEDIYLKQIPLIEKQIELLKNK
jgi:DNA polymerase elongation subunit (family B)